MNDAGLAYALKEILCQPTKAKAEAILDKIGADYIGLCRQIVLRLSFKRTIDQNSLYHKWLTEIGKHIGETKEEVERRVKLTHGCKILCRDDPEFLAFCQTALKPLPYENMLKAMDYIVVSSTMTTDQMGEYMDEIERTYRAQGVPLTIPEDA